MSQNRIPYQLLKKLAPEFGISPSNFSGILNGHRNVSKQRAIEFEGVGERLGCTLPAADWLLAPEKIKSVLITYGQVECDGISVTS